MLKNHIYAAIDLKSFYASVECIERGLNPLKNNLVVADNSRTDKTICLAVSPAFKAYGIPGRPRLFEVINKIKQINIERQRLNKNRDFIAKSINSAELNNNKQLKLDYIVATPRMSLYIEYSKRIYEIYLKHVSFEDIHVYSIDEVFLDITPYLKKEKLNISKVLELCGTGASSFITEISSGIVLIVFNAVILKLEGNIGVAAYGVVANLALVVIAIFTGIAQGVQPLVSKSYGSKDKEQLYYILRYSIILSIIVAISVYTAVFFSDTTLVSIFNKENNKKLFTLAVNGLHIYFTGFLFAGINIILSVFFSSMEHSKTGFIISITRGFVAIVPAVLMLSYIFGMTGVWLSFPIAEIFASFSVIYFINSNRNLFKK